MDNYRKYIDEMSRHFDNHVSTDKIINCKECDGFIILGSNESRHSIFCSLVPKCHHCGGRLDRGTLGHDINCNLVPKCECGTRLDYMTNHNDNCKKLPRCNECNGLINSGVSGHSKTCSQIVACEECGFIPLKNVRHYYNCSKTIKCNECGCPSIMLKGHYNTCSMF